MGIQMGIGFFLTLSVAAVCLAKKLVEECMYKLLCAPCTLLCCCRKHAFRYSEYSGAPTSEFGLNVV